MEKYLTILIGIIILILILFDQANHSQFEIESHTKERKVQIQTYQDKEVNCVITTHPDYHRPSISCVKQNNPRLPEASILDQELDHNLILSVIKREGISCRSISRSSIYKLGDISCVSSK